MRDVDEPHHAEDQRQPRREHGVEPAEQDALQDGVRASPSSHPEISRGDFLARQLGLRPAARRGPPAGNRHGRRLSAWTMSCSTMIERQAFATIAGKARVDVADDDRREAEADLVAEQKPRIGHQRAADRGHLLLAAGQRRPGWCRRSASIGKSS